MKLEDLSDDGKQELALALLLWKDFKADGKFDIELYMMMIELATMLGVKKELEFLISQLPPFKITPMI